MQSKEQLYFTENLNDLLKRDKRSASTIAKCLGINKSTLHNWQNGVAPQGIISLLKIAKYFNVSVHDLLFEKAKTTVLQQILLDEKYEITIRKCENNQGPKK